MKLKLTLLTLTTTLLLLLSNGCATPQKTAVNTLATVGATANAAYESYLQLVVQGQLPTNDLPKVTAYYRDFQASFGVATASAHYATNATLSNPELTGALEKLTSAIATIKLNHK